MMNDAAINSNSVQGQGQEEEEEKPATMKKVMQLNEAYEALEGMRKASLELEFGGMLQKDNRLEESLLDQYCTECLREQKNEPKPSGLFAPLQRAFQKQLQPSPCCMVCATPVCHRHGCNKDGLHICLGQCHPLLTATHLQERLTQLQDKEEERDRFVYNMMESYDRSLLLLQYAIECEDLTALANDLETNTRTSTHVQLGNSSLGFMAGITGVGAMAGPAATAAHVTVAATLAAASPPLLMASLVLGGTAACTTLGHELAIHKFYNSSAVQQRYRKLLAWQAVVKTIATVADDLQTKNCRELVVYQPPVDWIRLYGKGKRLYHSQLSDSTEPTEEYYYSDDSSFSESNDLGEFLSEAQVEEEEEEAKAEADDIDAPEKTVEDMQIASPERDVEADTPTVGAETDSAADTEVEPLLVSEEEPREDLEDCFAEELDQPKVDDKIVTPVTVNPKMEAILEDMDVILDEAAHEELESKLNKLDAQLDEKKKHALSFLIPLFPMLDDAILTVCKVFASPNAGAQMALSNAVNVTQIASIACGALSAFTIIFEANNMQRNLKRLEGPCDQAQQMRNLSMDVKEMPNTEVITDSFQRYLQATAA